MLSAEEIFELEDDIKMELEDNLTEILCNLNRQGLLEQFLKLTGLEHLICTAPQYQVYKNGQIVVLGQSEIKPDVMLTVANKLGIDKSRFNLFLNYEDAKTFNIKKLQWNPSYSAVLVGPMGHSGEGMGEYSSVIAAMENEDGYPPVVRMGTNSLKITKSGFKEALNNLLAENVIE